MATPDIVLAVVGDASVADVIRQSISDAGYRPTIVENASAARALLDARHQPCVVLFALQADEDARDFIRQHNADQRTARIPVIFFSIGVAGTHAPSPIVSALVAFVERYCDASSSYGNGPH